MALIIKGNMPDQCNDCLEARFNWSKETVKCGRTNTDVTDVHCSTRAKDCPIIGTIPDKHGPLKDSYNIMLNIRTAFCDKCRKRKVDKCSTCQVYKCWEIVRDAPVIVRAT